MRIIVCGGRDYGWNRAVRHPDKDVRDRGYRRAISQAYIAETVIVALKNDGTTIVQGGARGADSLVRAIAVTHGISVEDFPADWQTYGKAAGPIRNQKMVDAGADLVIAFPGGRGTEDMVARAKNAGVPVLRVEVDSNDAKNAN